MSWTYGCTPNVGLAIGRAGDLSITTPSVIPFHSALLYDSRNLKKMRAIGIPELLVRNTRNYAYHVSEREMEWSYSRQNNSFKEFQKHQFYLDNYSDYYSLSLHHKVAAADREKKKRNQEIEKRRQGNTLLAIEEPKVLVYATGEILNEIRVQNLDKRNQWTPDEDEALGIGSTVRQLEHLQGNAFVARGAATVSIIQMNQRYQLECKHEVLLPALSLHAAGNPYIPYESALITTGGSFSIWSPTHGYVDYGDGSSLGKLVSCAYSAHPCVLWGATSQFVSTIDTRTKPSSKHNLLSSTAQFHIDERDDISSRILALQRHPRKKFQYVVHTTSAIEVFDSRWVKEPVFSWEREYRENPNSIPGPSSVFFSREKECSSTTLILTGSSTLKKTTIRGYTDIMQENETVERCQLKPLLNNGSEDIPQFSRRIATGCPLDVFIPDQTTDCDLIGVCALERAAASTSEWGLSLFQMNSVGDIYRQDIDYLEAQAEDITTIVQPELPVGMSMDLSKDCSEKKEIALPMESFIEEHDAVSMGVVIDVRAEKLFQHDSPENSDDENLSIFKPQILEMFVSTCSLFHMYHHFKTTKQLRISCEAFLSLIQSMNSFRLELNCVSNDQAQVSIMPQSPLSVQDMPCKCLESMKKPADEISLCESEACIIPHLVTVTRSGFNPVTHISPGAKVTDNSGKAKRKWMIMIEDLEGEYSTDSFMTIKPDTLSSTILEE